MFGIKDKIDIFYFKLKWLRMHKSASIIPMSVFDAENVSIGKYSYGKIDVKIVSDSKYKLYIGSFCSIASNVTFLLSIGHPTNHLSTYPFKARIIAPNSAEATSKGNIIVQDDVWIGYGATILSGLTIHQGAVIAAGAVVTKDIPPYAIAAGVPARVIKYRFSEPVISFLLTLDYSQLTEDMIRTHIDDLYTPLDTLSLDQIRSLYSWFPEKRADMAASATASAASSTATTPGADASADSAPSELTTTQQQHYQQQYHHYQCAQYGQYDPNAHTSENTTKNTTASNSEVELLMMDQNSINSIIAVIQDSDLPLIKTTLLPVTLSIEQNTGRVFQNVSMVICDHIGFNEGTTLANAWVADNILLFTVFDGALENRYGLQEGASFRNHYDNIPEATDLDKMSKFCYRVMKLIRNAIQHNLSAVQYTPPSGSSSGSSGQTASSATSAASFGSYSINYTHKGTTFSLDIDNKAVQFLYTIVVNLVTNSINKMQLTQGHYEGILNATFDQMKEGISSLSDDIGVWSNTNTVSTATTSWTSPSQQSQQSQQHSQQPSTAKYDAQHLRFYQRYVVKNPVIVQDNVDDVGNTGCSGSSNNSGFVIFKHIEENATNDETSNQYWYSTDYRYKDYLLPQELGSITWGTGADDISRREQATIRFNKADITDRWKIR